MSDTPLHPHLQRLLANERRMTRLLSLIVFMPLAGLMLFAMTLALRGNTLGDLLFLASVAGIVLLLVAAAAGMLAWLHQRSQQRIVAANRLLAASGVPVHLHWSGRKCLAGCLVALESAAGAPLGTAAIACRQRQPPQQLQGVAQLYCEQHQVGAQLVLVQGDYALLGRWVGAPAAYEQRRWVVAALLAVVAALVVSFALRH